MRTERLGLALCAHGSFCVLLAACSTIDPTPPPPLDGATLSAVAYLEREVPAWSRDNGCHSCHHDGDGFRALIAARRAGASVSSDALAPTLAWLSEPESWDEGEESPEFVDRRLAALQFALALESALDARLEVRRDALEVAALELVELQRDDGSWSADTPEPVGSPTTWGASLATASALRVLQRSTSAASHEAAERAEAWLLRTPPRNLPAAVALVLAFGAADVQESSDDPRSAARAAAVDEGLRIVRDGQSARGGWGPWPNAPPETFDTALALLALSRIGDERDAEAIAGGRRFLVELQAPYGGWPETTRPAGGSSHAQHTSTTAWATLALLATRPPEPTAAQEP